MEPPVDTSSPGRVRSLYDQLINSWNSSDPTGFAALFCEDGEIIGADGFPLSGRTEIAAHLRHRFTEQPPPAQVALVRSIRLPVAEAAVLSAAVGMVPAGGQDIDPDLNALQVLVAALTEGGWRAVSLQTTLAPFNGQPDLRLALTAELRQQLRLMVG